MLTRPRFFQFAALGLIASCSAVAAPDVMAQQRHDSNRHDNSRQVSVQRDARNNSVRISVSTRGRADSNQRYDNQRNDPRRYDNRGHDDRQQYGRRDRRQPTRYVNRDSHAGHNHAPVCPPQPTGYWRTVYHPPVYRTVYDRCGYPRRVLVQRGHYDRVWVAYGRHTGHGHRQVH